MRCATATLLCAQLVLAFSSTATNAHGKSSLSCDDLVVAGAGPGGLYSAWRLIEAGLIDPSKTCIFEHTNRVGECWGDEAVDP